MAHPILERAIIIATEAHSGQVDKSGEPYILHPLRVMGRVNRHGDRVVAVLHDVIEDAEGYTISLMEECFGREIAAALECLTKREGEPYHQYLDRVLRNPIALRVKFADLADNSDMHRLSNLAPDVRDRLFRKYSEAAAYLRRHMEVT